MFYHPFCYISKRVVLSVLLVLTALSALHAQKQQNYIGPYRLTDNISGTAAYAFYLSKNDTIKNGAFTFQSFFIDTTEEKISRAIRYSGNFKNGKKNGVWNFNSKSMQPGSRFEEKNYEIIYRINGMEYSVNGNFNEGKPEGQWEMLRQNIFNSSPIDTLLFVKANFSKGKMQGAVEGRQLNILFSGKVSDEGFLDSSWVFRHFSPSGNPVTEHRIFVNGILQSHFFVEDEDTVTLRYAGLDDATDRKENWENLNIDTRYFNILKSANVQSDVPHELFTDKSNSILENAAFAFSRFDGEPVWDKLDGSVSPNPAQVRLGKFPFSVEEEIAMREAGEKLKIITGKLDTFFNSPDIELERHAEKTMMFYYEVMKVYQSKAGKLQQLVKQFSIPAFEYINHDEIFEYMMPDMTYPGKIEYEFKSEIFKEEYFFPERLQKDNGNLSLTLRHIEAILIDVKKIEREADEILVKKERLSKLVDKEKQLVKKKDSILSLYLAGVRLDDFNEYHRMVASSIETYATNKFKEYAGLSSQEKIERIDVLIGCFNGFIQLYDVLADLPRKLNRLDEAYTRTVWNPYTMTDMEERMKERVYKAFETYLFPYYLDEIKSSIDCNDIANKTGIFDLIYNRMLELREQDTKDLEKELRRITSPERIFDVLNIQLNTIE